MAGRRPPKRAPKRPSRAGLARDGKAIAERIDEQAKTVKERKRKQPGSPATQFFRDTLMPTRLAQGWTLKAIAEEAGVSLRTADRAIERRKKETPLVLHMDPVKVVEDIMLGLQLSVGDLEFLGPEATRAHNYAAAVGARRAANDARGQVISLLQDIGRLPQDLSSLRHLLDLKEVAVRMVQAVDVFVEEVDRGTEPETAAAQVRRTFDEPIGADSPPELEAAS